MGRPAKQAISISVFAHGLSDISPTGSHVTPHKILIFQATRKRRGIRNNKKSIAKSLTIMNIFLSSKNYLHFNYCVPAKSEAHESWAADLQVFVVPHFSKPLSDLKQNGTQKRHHFLAQFSIPFHMVWSVLLRVVAQKTTF